MAIRRSVTHVAADDFGKTQGVADGQWANYRSDGF